MIKAKKGLLIALFAAMMMFAFGATSVFATTTDANGYVWSDDFSTVTIDGQAYPTTRELQSSGMIKADIDLSDYSPAPTISPAVQPMYFYDMQGAALDYVGNYSKTNFDALFTGDKIANAKLVLTTPAYVKDYASQAKTTKTQLTGWNAEIALPESYDKTATGDQTVTLSAVLSSTGEATGTATAPYMINKPAAPMTKEILVKGAGGVVQFFWDEAKGTALFTDTNADGDNPVAVALNYDGKAHKIINTTAANKTVAYSVLNKTTGSYDAVAECPEIKSVGDDCTVRATITWTTKAGSTTTTHNETATFTITVGKATVTPSYEWTDGNGGFHNGVPFEYSVTSDQAKDFASFIEFKNGFTADTADKTADLDTIKEFFNERYDVTVENNAIDSALQTWKIEAKDLSDADKTALEKKYKALLANYTFLTDDTMNRIGGATVSVLVQDTANTKDDDITFITAPNMKYKAKKLKKKAASFTVEAIADSGNAITYLMTSPDKKISIDSATGTITIAKKIKKGTYPVKIKAKTNAGNGYKACKEVVELTIKVK